jgi:hypothetical protein
MNFMDTAAARTTAASTDTGMGPRAGHRWF